MTSAASSLHPVHLLAVAMTTSSPTAEVRDRSPHGLRALEEGLSLWKMREACVWHGCCGRLAWCSLPLQSWGPDPRCHPRSFCFGKTLTPRSALAPASQTAAAGVPERLEGGVWLTSCEVCN